MRLLTLGGLSLEDHAFGRVKPLLLLTYLAIEGPKERRHLSQLFWPRASDPMNSLSAALTRLRKNVEGAVAADEVRAWAKIEVDAAELLSALERDPENAVALYRGPFLHGAHLSDWGVELEEWVYSTREDLAGRVRRAMLTLAEREAAQGHFAAAAGQAEAAHTLSGTPEYEPEELTRLHLILQAGESPLAPRIRDEAAAFGLELGHSSPEARALLQRVLVGRERESARLAQLGPGEWAWVRGGAGMGKTALLKTLQGTYLPGRAGLPYATLEPLLGSALQEGEAAILQRLLRLESRWLVDNWGRMDEQSKAMLTRVFELRTRAGVVVTSRERPPFAVDLQLELGPVPEDALSPEAWKKTQGMPALVEAFLRGEPLEAALETRLTALSPEARDVYLALSLLDAPDLALVRRALGMEAAVTARVFEELLSAGFVEPSGQARVRQAAQDYLEAHPTLLAPLAIRLARLLGDLDAFPLFERSRYLWEDADTPKAIAAYLAWATELLKRGFPQGAYDVLTDAPASDAVTFLKARALERAGRYQEAFDCLADLTETPDVLALKSTLLWRLGKPEAARIAAQGALHGEMFARAEAQNTLGHIDRSAGIYESASTYFRRAAALWSALGSRDRQAAALNNVAMVQDELGENVDEAFQEALKAAGENLVERARILLNLGLSLERRNSVEEAEKMYLEVVTVSEKIGAIEIAGKAWNNLGVIYENQSLIADARRAYRSALTLARQAGEPYLVGLALANLAELDGDPDSWQEAMRIFEASGRHAIVKRYMSRIPPDHPVRQRSGKKV